MDRRGVEPLTSAMCRRCSNPLQRVSSKRLASAHPRRGRAGRLACGHVVWCDTAQSLGAVPAPGDCDRTDPGPSSLQDVPHGVAHIPGRQRASEAPPHATDLACLGCLLVAADHLGDTLHAVPPKDPLDHARATRGDHDDTVCSGEPLDHRGHVREELRAGQGAEGVLELFHHLRRQAGSIKRRKPVALGEAEELLGRRQLRVPGGQQRFDISATLVIKRVGDHAVEVEHEQRSRGARPARLHANLRKGRASKRQPSPMRMP